MEDTTLAAPPQRKNATPPAKLDAWLAYAAAGIPTFPATREKKPLIKNNLASATTDKGTILEWARKFPDASIAMVTGSGSGIIVLDIDQKPGRDGFASLAELEAQFSPLPREVVRKGGAGEQLFFACPHGVRIKNVSDQILPGLDVRGCAADGSPKGFTILPPSTRSDGTEYSWEGHSEIFLHTGCAPDAPSWLLFRMVFNKREREQLAAAGINGHAGFGDAPPAEWERLANEKRAASWRAQRVAKRPREKLPALDPKALGRYLRNAIESELQGIKQSQPGHQEQTMNAAGLKIHGLLKGATLCGMDVAALTAGVRDLFIKATVAMTAGNRTAPWTEGHASAKWERTEDDAAPRDLFDVSFPERAFGAIEPSRGGEVIDAAAPYIEYPDTTQKGTPLATLPNLQAYLAAQGFQIHPCALSSGAIVSH